MDEYGNILSLNKFYGPISKNELLSYTTLLEDIDFMNENINDKELIMLAIFTDGYIILTNYYKLYINHRQTYYYNDIFTDNMSISMNVSDTEQFINVANITNLLYKYIYYYENNAIDYYMSNNAPYSIFTFLNLYLAINYAKQKLSTEYITDDSINNILMKIKNYKDIQLELTAKVKEYKNECDILIPTIKELERKNEVLTLSITELKKSHEYDVEFLNDKHISLIDDMENNKHLNELLIIDLSDQLATIKSNNSSLENNINFKNAKLKSLKKSIQVLNEQNDDLTNKLNVSINNNHNLTQSNAESNKKNLQKINSLIEENTKYTTLIKDLTHENNKLKGELIKCNEKLMQCNKEIEALKDKHINNINIIDDFIN